MSVEIICPRCGYQTTLVKNIRCPRCFENLMAVSPCGGNCSKCSIRNAAKSTCG